MTQVATVEKLLKGGMAQISVPRKSACGHDCENCAGCGVTGSVVLAEARNPLGALPGQKVEVESENRRLLGVMALVYLLPLAFFFAGYFLSPGSEEAHALFACAAFLLGLIPAVACDRRLRRRGGIVMTIVRIL